jgi:demethylmenaquinone methyltransferase/2-methoxy-6-polyprenyl-1,4-benzoquinol methylase
MLDIAQAQVDRRLARRPGPRPKVTLIAGDLLRQELGLGSGSFDVVTLGWGLRYVANVPAALERVRSFLRPGGRLVVLEFTRPRNSGCLSDWRHHPAIPAQLFFRYAVPRIGSWLAGDSEAYEYMRVSSAAFPEAEVLVAAITEAGLTVTHEHRRIGGLVTVIAGVLM